MRARIASAFAALFGCVTWKEHDLRVSALLRASSREVQRRRDAEDGVLIYSNFLREMLDAHHQGNDSKIPWLLEQLEEATRPLSYKEDTH
jgi:hypothetical protein